MKPRSGNFIAGYESPLSHLLKCHGQVIIGIALEQEANCQLIPKAKLMLSSLDTVYTLTVCSCDDGSSV